MTRIGIQILCISLLLCGAARADEPPALATDAQRKIHEATLADKTWSEDEEKANASYNKDDLLLQDDIDARAAAPELAKDPLFAEGVAEEVAAPYLDAARDMAKQAEKSMSERLAEMVGGDATVQGILQAAEEQSGAPEVLAKYQLAVSRGMGEGAIRKVMEIGRNNPDLVIVFRGVLPGERVADLVSFLMTINPPIEGEPMANVIIDPTVFTENAITVVPTLQRVDRAGDVVASVRGVANPQWIEERVERGERGDLGKYGETGEIAEEDIIEVMKRQLIAAKPEERAKRQLENYWKSQTWASLPTATEDRTRMVDPTVVVADGIYGPDGTVIAYPGQRINPFDAIPFDMTVVVIDGRDPRQVAFARQKVVELEGKQVIVATTEVDTDKGWAGYNDLIVSVGRMVYVLQPQMVERFQIEKVPCTVEGGDRVLIVKEYAAETLSSHGEADDASSNQKAG